MKNNGFAVLVFVIVMALALLFLMINYAENQKKIAENVRKIIKTERSLQSALLCVGYISNTLSRYPLLNEELLENIKTYSDSSLTDRNYWINKSLDYRSKNRREEYFNCKVVDFQKCLGSSNLNNYGELSNNCNYYGIIEGWNIFHDQYGDVGEDNNSRVYVEWKLDEYRFYIRKLKLIKTL